MTNLVVIGVDPGVTTGLCRWEPHQDFPLEHTKPELAQTTPSATVTLIDAWLNLRPTGSHVLVAIEAFMLGKYSTRSGDPEAPRITQALIADITSMVEDFPHGEVSLHPRAAAHVKPWATNARLDAAGLLKVSSAYPKHARDALRHGLYSACKDGGLRDPFGRWGPRG